MWFGACSSGGPTVLRQHLGAAIPVPACSSTANPSHTLPYTSKALRYELSFHLSFFVPHLLHISERKLKHRLQHICSPPASKDVKGSVSTSPLLHLVLASTWVPPAHGVELYITVHHPYAMASSMLPSSPFFMQSNTVGGVCRVSATCHSAMAPISLPSAH